MASRLLLFSVVDKNNGIFLCLKMMILFVVRKHKKLKITLFWDSYRIILKNGRKNISNKIPTRKSTYLIISIAKFEEKYNYTFNWDR